MVHKCVNTAGRIVDVGDDSLDILLANGGRIATTEDLKKAEVKLKPVGSVWVEAHGLSEEVTLVKEPAVFGIFYDDKSKPFVKDSIPYQNGISHNFENDVILDIWANHRPAWINAKYVSVLSWRFEEKTGLSFSDATDILNSSRKDAISFFPKGYEQFNHPFSRNGYASVLDSMLYLDSVKAFKTPLASFRTKTPVWCNYWALKPELFDLYCTAYLNKAISLLKETSIYNACEMHRGKQYVGTTFFLEGLFSYFVQTERLSHKIY